MELEKKSGVNFRFDNRGFYAWILTKHSVDPASFSSKFGLIFWPSGYVMKLFTIPQSSSREETMFLSARSKAKIHRGRFDHV